jgi:hypothetical protein
MRADFPPSLFRDVGNERERRALLWRGTEASLPMFATLTDKLRTQRSWRRADELLAKMRPHCVTEIEQDEERCLEAMLHWHDPMERLRTFHCRRHALVDDNPTSG